MVAPFPSAFHGVVVASVLAACSSSSSSPPPPTVITPAVVPSVNDRPHLSAQSAPASSPIGPGLRAPPNPVAATPPDPPAARPASLHTTGDAGAAGSAPIAATGHDGHAEPDQHAGPGHGGGPPPGHVADMQAALRPLAHGAATPGLSARICAQARNLLDRAAAIEAAPVPEPLRARAVGWRAGTSRVTQAATALVTTCAQPRGNAVAERLDALHTAFHDLTDDL